MSMSEYEERFRAPAPSLHQRFAAMRGPRRERRRIRLFWIAAAVAIVVIESIEVGAHHAAGNAVAGRPEVRYPALDAARPSLGRVEVRR